MERTLTRKGKNKPQLIIQTSADQTNDKKSFKRKTLYKNEVQIKPLMSAKNKHEMKNSFSFPKIAQNPFNFVNKQQNKLKTLQRLQSQRTQLMKSLQILKQGAVSAIVQKQQQIQKLKQQIYVSSISSLKSIQKQQQQKLHSKISQKQIQLKQIYRKQLQQQVQELRKQLRKQRIRYQSELHQKQQIINSLCVELNDSYQKIQYMEKEDMLMNEKIKNIELQNISLLKELENSHINSSQQLNTSFFLNLSNVTQKSRIKSHNSQQAFDDVQFGDLSYASTIPIKKYSQNMILGQQQDYMSNSFISQRIQSIKQKHKQQINQIKQNYQTQISRLKKMYQNKQSQNQKKSQSSNRKSLTRMGSVQSFKSARSSHRQSEQPHKLLKFKTNSFTNLNLNKLQSKYNQIEGLNFQQKMQSIIQRGQYDQAGTPRYHVSLKQQILRQQSTSNVNYDTITNSSNVHNYFNNMNSSQRNFLNYDTISQFTANHFEYPPNTLGQQKLFRRTNSIATFQGQTDQATTKDPKKFVSLQDNLGSYKQTLHKYPSKILSVQDSQEGSKFVPRSQSSSDQQDKVSRKSQKTLNKNSSTSSLKKDIMLFCVGLVTGGTLIGMGSKMFKK